MPVSYPTVYLDLRTVLPPGKLRRWHFHEVKFSREDMVWDGDKAHFSIWKWGGGFGMIRKKWFAERNGVGPVMRCIEM